MTFSEQLADLIRAALVIGLTPEDVAILLARALPEIVDRRQAHALIEATYDLYAHERPEIDRSLPFETGPFRRLGRE